LTIALPDIWSATNSRRFRRGLLARDAEHSYLALEDSDEDPMDQLRGQVNPGCK